MNVVDIAIGAVFCLTGIFHTRYYWPAERGEKDTSDGNDSDDDYIDAIIGVICIATGAMFIVVGFNPEWIG